MQMSPPILVGLAKNYKPEFNFLTILIAIFTLSTIGVLIYLWVLGVFATPILACGIIAPNQQVGSVIFGTLFCLSLIYYIVWIFNHSHWLSILYHVIFGALFMNGIIAAYKTNRESGNP